MTEEVIKQLAEKYNFDFGNPAPYRDGFILYAKNISPHSLHIKKADLSEDRINFNHLVKDHLIKQGFSNTDKYIPTKEGLPFVKINDVLYVAVTKINGSEASFESLQDTAKAAIALASMHVASIGGSYDIKKYPFAFKDLGNISNIFHHRVNELKKFKRMAAKGKNIFDYEYTKYAGYFIEEGERAIENIEKSAYFSMVDHTLSDGSLCHHDFTSHNVIFHDNTTYLTGFENCCVEIKEYDLANFIRRKMRRTGWSLSDAKNIVDNYRSICRIDEDELNVLRIILSFPQKLWRIVNKYYNSRRSWCERSCLEKMKDVLEEKDPLHIFLKNFDLIY